jgi:hypothetical protein
MAIRATLISGLNGNIRTLKPSLVNQAVVTRLFGILLLTIFMPNALHAADKVLKAKCGDCHRLSSELDRAEFDDVLTSYSWANWSNVPLRVWLSNHHKPRIPSINISESEASKISGYIASLHLSTKLSETAAPGSGAFFADAEVLEPVEQANGVAVDDQGAAKLRGMDDGVLEKHETIDDEETTVDYGECLNCQ